jgi:hypothetical protein
VELVPPPARHQKTSADRCFRCRAGTSADEVAYCYLLGLYLGDGHLVATTRVPVLAIACTEIYPNLIDACEEAMRATLATSVHRVQKKGCVMVRSYSTHWPCLLPQHGPGHKHERPIILADWQRALVETQPGAFVRGLFHSDGCRVINKVTVRGRSYAYPRYLFANESADILGLCGWGLDLLGVAWRANRRNCLSVARREAVAELDRWVGPKS